MAVRSLRRLAIAALLVGIVAGVARRIPLDYYAFGPAPARSVEQLTIFSGRERFPSAGAFLFTAVSVQQVTALGLVEGWLDPAVDVLPGEDVFPDGGTLQQVLDRGISQMDQSKLNAVAAALREVTDYPRERGDGVLVQGVVPGCAADGELFPGDLILRVDGVAVRGVREAAAAIAAAASGATITFDITVDGAPEVVELVREPCGGSEEPLVGVSLIDAFPFDVTIDSGSVGGPSAGLMFALGLVDLLEPGDLTGGRTIAGTGEIRADGRVGPIGGVRQKLVAAVRAGATVFILPQRNLAEAQAAGLPIRLVPVRTLADAIAFLRG